MDIGSLLLIAAVILLVGVFVSRPFFEGRRPQMGAIFLAAEEKEHLRSSLMAERDRVLNALQELDFDHTLGKIPEEEYPQQRAALLKEGADMLRQLDAIQEEVHAQSVEERVEAAVAARRADAVHRGTPAPAFAAASGPLADDKLEHMIAERRNHQHEGAAGFCPSCGKPVQKSDQFCPKCGKRL
jgi:hypothetical protein